MKKFKLFLILKENILNIKCYLYTNKVIEISKKFSYSEFLNKTNILDLNFILKKFFYYLKNELDKHCVIKKSLLYKEFVKKSKLNIEFFKEFFYLTNAKKLILPEHEFLNIKITENCVKNNPQNINNISINNIILNKKKLKKLSFNNSLSDETKLPHYIENLFLNILNNKETDYLNIIFFKELNNIKNLKINKKLTLNNIRIIKENFNIDYNDNIIINLEDVWNIKQNFLKNKKIIKKISINFFNELVGLNYSEIFIEHIKKYTKETFIFNGASYNINILNNKNFNVLTFYSLRNLILKNFVNNSKNLQVFNCNNVIYSVYEREFLESIKIKKNIIKNLIFNNINKLELFFNSGILKILKNIEINNNNYVIFNIVLDELNYQNLKFLLFNGIKNKKIKFYLRVFSYKTIVFILNFIADNYKFLKENNIKIHIISVILNNNVISYQIISKINKILKKYLYKDFEQFKYNLKNLYIKNYLNKNIKIKKIKDIPNFLEKDLNYLFKKNSHYINNII